MTTKTGATTARPADPCSLIIFGASGDLTHRLLVPALYNLAVEGLLPEAFALIGVARSDWSNETFRSDLAKSLPKFATRQIDESAVKRVLDCVAYVRGGPDDDETYRAIGQTLAAHRARAANARQPAVLSGDAAGRLCADRPPSRRIRSGAGGERRLAPRRRRKAVRHRLGLGAGA